MSTSEDVSITATEATVAGSSVALTEAEEDAASFTQSAGGDDNVNKERMILTKESSVKGISIANDDSTEGGDDDEEEEGDEEYAAPMHLHALRTPARLKGVRSRSSSRPGSRTGSRRNSPSPSRKVAGVGELIIGGITLSPSQSAESSLDGIGDHVSQRSSFSGDGFDPDILLDKLGFRDLDPDVTQEELQELLRKHISSNNSGLATLNERMSEETMDDVHAFQDLQFVKRSPPTPSKDELDGEDTSPAPSSKGESDGEDTSPEKDTNRREMLNKTGLSSSAVMGSMSYLMNNIDEGEEEGDDDDEGGKGIDIILEIPDGIASGGKSKKKRDSTISTMAVAGDSSFDDDDEDAEVAVPTSIMKELKISEGKRRHKHRDTELAAAGNDVDFLEDDEQDGLEADLSEDEPR
mmetsp:Transcript_28504/g.52632  ORF Transcript_28504/g.52632 Transcript_28504/m.52632 type:complete len:409 (-) Transcript_28504:291-1517(-)